jgi:hypothetical protein
VSGLTSTIGAIAGACGSYAAWKVSRALANYFAQGRLSWRALLLLMHDVSAESDIANFLRAYKRMLRRGSLFALQQALIGGAALTPLLAAYAGMHFISQWIEPNEFIPRYGTAADWSFAVAATVTSVTTLWTTLPRGNSL